MDTGESDGVVESNEYAITVAKSWHAGDDGFVVAYTLESDESVPVEVSFTDQLPVPDPIEIGCNPSQSPLHWDHWGEEISIVHHVPPSETESIEIGVVLDDDISLDDIESADPIIQTVQPVSAPEHVTLDVPGAGETAEWEEIEADEESDPTQFDRPTDTQPAGTESNDQPADSPEFQTGTPEDILTAVVEAIETIDESGPLFERLQEAIPPKRPRSEQVRLKHVQGKMDDFEAYVQTLETFIDEHGELHAWARSVNEQIDTIEAELHELHETVSANNAHVTDQIAQTESTVEELDATVSTLAERIDDSEHRVAAAFAGMEQALATTDFEEDPA